MASILPKTVGLSLVMLVTACSTSQQSKREPLGNDNYLKTANTHVINSVPGITLPIPYTDYNIPSVATTGALGKAVDIRPPDQVIPTIRGIRAQAEGNSGIVIFDFALEQGLSTLINKVMIDKNYTVESRQGNTFVTDWISWPRGDEDIPYKARYEISIKDTGYQEAVAVKLIDIRHQGDDTVTDSAQIHRYTVAMVNSLISGMEAILTQQSHEQAESSDASLPVTTATDDGGLPVLVVRGPYQTVWKRLPAALAKVGMTITESNQSYGTMTIKYRALSDANLQALDVIDPRLDKSDYTLQVGDLDNRTSLQFRSKAGKPLNETENLALQSLIQAAFSHSSVAQSQ